MSNLRSNWARALSYRLWDCKSTPRRILRYSTRSTGGSRFRDTELLTNRLLATSAGVATRLEYLVDELKHLEETHTVQQGYKTYQLYPQETTFEKEFVVEDSSYTRAGPSHWGFASLVSGHKNVLGQSTAIRGIAEVHGTYALLRRHNFYDFTLHVELLVGTRSESKCGHLPHNYFTAYGEWQRRYCFQNEGPRQWISATDASEGWEEKPCPLRKRHFKGNCGTKRWRIYARCLA